MEDYTTERDRELEGKKRVFACKRKKERLKC